MTDSLAAFQGKRGPVFIARLERPFTALVARLAFRRNSAVGYGASLLKVFLPYLVWNTVFDNSRVVTEMGRAPAPFSQYCYPLLKFSKEGRFTYDYKEWPDGAGGGSQ